MNAYEPRGVLMQTTASLLKDDRRCARVAVTFSYTADDPWAISMDILTDTVLVPWTFARDLLADGLNGPVGEGDVRVRPAELALRIGLSSPSGASTLEFDRAKVERLVEQTELLVPLGAESDHVDWDYALSTLAHGGER